MPCLSANEDAIHPATMAGQAFPHEGDSQYRAILRAKMAGQESVSQRNSLIAPDLAPKWRDFMRGDRADEGDEVLTRRHVEAEAHPLRILVNGYHPGPALIQQAHDHNPPFRPALIRSLRTAGGDANRGRTGVASAS
jgi:hypothetical protein